MAKTLFLITKTFPFGHGEQYIAEELPFLSREFEKIIFVPCSIFEKQPKQSYVIPAGSEIFLVNNHILPKGIGERIRNMLFISGIVLDAALHNSDGSYFYKHLRQSIAIMRQQLGCATAFARYMKERSIDPSCAVFYSYWVHSSCIILGILKRRKVIRKFISRAHAYDLYHQDFFPEQKDRTPLPWERFKFRMTDIVYCISEHGVRYLEKKYPQWRGKFVVNRLGVEVPGTVNPPASSHEKFRIVTCGTVQPRKRIASVPEIMSHLDFPVEWVHFGGGEDKDVSAMKSAWEKFRKPRHNFVFKGHTVNKEIKEFYATQHVDLFMNLSLAEGVPVALMEAAGYGIPLLATDVYANTEIANPSCGFVVPKNFTAEEVAACIRTLSMDKAMQERKRKAAREIQEQYYDARKNFEQFSKEISKL